METTIEQLRTMRANLPKGKKDPWGECCRNKRVLLQRVLRERSKMDELTEGEYAAVQEFVDYAAQFNKDREREINRLAKNVNKLSQQ